MISIIQDTREAAPLTFSKMDGVEVIQECLPVGDYGARMAGVMDRTVFERKSIGDLFGSFSSGYERERAKIEKAKSLGLRLILAIEGTLFDIREGYKYWKEGEWVYSKKDGLTQIRQLMTLSRKGLEIWYFRDRREMAFGIQEYFFSLARAK